MKLITIIFDKTKKKNRAVTNDGKFVKFPNNLRKLGARFKARLQKAVSKNGVESYTVIGQIIKL